MTIRDGSDDDSDSDDSGDSGDGDDSRDSGDSRGSRDSGDSGGPAGAQVLRGGLDPLGLDQPRPMNGMVVAVTVMNCTLASSGSPAMNSTASATCRTSNVGSGTTRPSA